MKGFLKGNCTTTPLKPFFYWNTAFITHSLVSWLMINPRCGVVIKSLVPMPNKGKLGKNNCTVWTLESRFLCEDSTVQCSGRYIVVEQLNFPVAKIQITTLSKYWKFVWECFASLSSVIGAHLCLKAVNNILPNFFCFLQLNKCCFKGRMCWQRRVCSDTDSLSGTVSVRCTALCWQSG